MKQNKSRSGAEKLKDSLIEDVQQFMHDHPTHHGVETDLSDKTIFVDFEQHKVIAPPQPPEEALKLSKMQSVNTNQSISKDPHQIQVGNLNEGSVSQATKDSTKIQFFDVEEPIEDFEINVSEYQSDKKNGENVEVRIVDNNIDPYSGNEYISESPEYDPLNLPKAALHDDEPDYMADLFPDDKTQVIGQEELEKTMVVQTQQKKMNSVKNKIELFEPPIQNLNKKFNESTTSQYPFAGADALNIAQEKIKNLEAEVDRLRADNDELSSSADVIKQKVIEYRTELQKVENDKANLEEILSSEIHILKGNLKYRDQETSKSQQEIEVLKARLKSDFKKIRVRERELENRLELLRVEKATLLKTKDEQILDLKRKIDQLQMENDNYRQKCIELNRTIEGNQDQFKRTVRALRLALTNLESKDPGSIKKAE